MSKKLMRKKLAMMLATLKKKRKFFCELEYLESTGTQYINTGLLSTANSKVDIVFGFTSMESGAANNCAIFGGRTNTTTNTFTFFKIASATPQYFRFDYNSQPTAGSSSDLTWNATSKYRFTYDGSTLKTDNITMGESYSAARVPGSTFTTSPITLFAVNTNNQVGQFMSGRIYKYWYTDGTNTIDLIPVLDWNGVACMYDKVSGQLFYNQGTGDFTAGREIHPVEYLETLDNTNWITTTFKPTATTNIETKVRCITTSTTLTTWALGASTWWGVHLKDSTQIGIVNGTLAERQAYCPYSVNTDVVLKLDGSNVYVDGNLVGSITKTSATSTLDLFRYYNASNLYWRGRIYYFKADDNGTPVLDMIPAIDETGKGYLFDQVSHTIFDNAGSGNFAYPPVEIEYLESTGSQYIDTGLTLSASDIIYTKTYLGNSNSLFGVITSDSNYWYNMTSLGRFYFGSSTQNNANLTLGQTYEFEFGNTYKVNGETKFTFEKTFGDGNLTCPIFCRNHTSSGYSDFFAGKVYYFKIVRNGTIRCDFIPAYKNGVACMVDKLTGTAYLNQGTGSFSTGRILESEYE